MVPLVSTCSAQFRNRCHKSSLKSFKKLYICRMIKISTTAYITNNFGYTETWGHCDF